MAKRGPKEVTPEHKAAMAAGRVEGRAVRDYLEALRANKPKRGRKRTPDSIRKQIEAINTKLGDSDAVTSLKLISDRMHLQEELSDMGTMVDLTGLQNEFVKVAKRYGERNRITYAAWREVGVPPTVLSEAGIGRSAG